MPAGARVKALKRNTVLEALPQLLDELKVFVMQFSLLHLTPFAFQLLWACLWGHHTGGMFGSLMKTNHCSSKLLVNHIILSSLCSLTLVQLVMLLVSLRLFLALVNALIPCGLVLVRQSLQITLPSILLLRCSFRPLTGVPF